MSFNKATIGLQKQNDGIYTSLTNKGIQFERVIISPDADEDTILALLKEENAKLKELANANKPPPQPKAEKKPQIPHPKKESKPKNNNENNEDEEENFEEPVKKFDTITNMEELKRAFFNNDYETFESQIKSHPFKFYNVEYKYNSDKDGVPDFSAKNLLKGFVRSFDSYRKYFMICFRCLKNQHETKYKYESLWIVNTNEPFSNIIGSISDDFIFTESTDIDKFISDIKKLPETDEPTYINEYTCLGESYVH